MYITEIKPGDLYCPDDFPLMVIAGRDATGEIYGMQYDIKDYRRCVEINIDGLGQVVYKKGSNLYVATCKEAYHTRFETAIKQIRWRYEQLRNDRNNRTARQS